MSKQTSSSEELEDTGSRLHCCCPWHCRYLIPGGSAGHFHREGYIFDVGSSMMFGMGHNGTTNLITRALAAVGKQIDTSPDPTQIHYHLPKSDAHPQVWEVTANRQPLLPGIVNVSQGIAAYSLHLSLCMDLSRFQPLISALMYS